MPSMSAAASLAKRWRGVPVTPARNASIDPASASVESREASARPFDTLLTTCVRVR